jgi:excisionase family DNA binding protein
MPKQPSTDRPWLRITEAADRAQCSVPTLRRELRNGKLRAIRLAGRKSLRFKPEWIDAWMLAGEIEVRRG